MFELASARLRSSSNSALWFSAVLLVDNNAEHTREQLLEWIAHYREPRRRSPFRMLFRSRINMGYLCGELHSLAASVQVWRRFPWVLYNSGPDSMLVS
jgi:hypothetical protein